MIHPLTTFCIVEMPDGSLRCRNRNISFRADRQPITCCRSLPILSKTSRCPFAPVVSSLTPSGVDRLQRCRDAGCKLMLPVEGSIRCVGMPGSKCRWIAEWAARLNDAVWVCPHWKEIKACASRQ